MAGSVIACYGLFLYEMLPEYLFIPTSALIYFGIPSIAIVCILVVVPLFLSKGAKGMPSQAGAESLGLAPQPQFETIALEQTKEQGMILPDSGLGGGMQGMMQGQMATPLSETTSAVIQAPVVDEIAVQDMVSRAMEPVQKDSTRMQDTITDLRNEINAIKASMDSLSATVESSLTDLKSFQAELANPLNFMRKYFDSIDIKSLSDPSLPLQVERLQLPEPLQIEDARKNDSSADTYGEAKDTSKSKETAPEPSPKTPEPDMSLSSVSEVMDFKQMLGGKITLGRLMTTISLMEEILQTLGRDSIDVLIDQCKLMGLNQEDEHVVYNVINMMDKSGLSVKDTLIMLYKFGKVMGMNDKESDLIYAKLMMNHGKNHDNALIVEKKAG